MNNLQNSNEIQVENAGKLIGSLPKESLKSLFYLCVGKPDSRTKVFSSAVFLEKDDIIELNECITRKLKIHNIDAQITTVSVGKGTDISEFGTWREFEEHHWHEPECIEELVIKWDFMITLPDYKIPQRHTLLVRISCDMKPGKFLQMVASGNADDFDQMDILTAPAFCRVDFINSQISKELINEVSDWYEGRKEPELIPSKFYWFKLRKNIVAMLIHHSFALMFSLVWVTAYLWLDTNKFSGNITLQASALWIFIGIYMLTPVTKFGHIIASRVYSELSELEGSRVVFQFTSGDKKKLSELANYNKKKGRSFAMKSLFAFLINILAGICSTYLYLNS
ncbi:hypothetical protein [Pseudoalteromonas sp. S16_S37]|uniref:hypothetical protein n=1 Tax=Pseudoalteromonas sp. S16_S37 TaxID=2720228 RepID=UPI00167FED03|nr:hypothetical protein [Pseudoalteromonas sp. S16_S37]MBD1583346.1 hypothetical protein [Pseudoalteromonas sp. S16_S37]